MKESTKHTLCILPPFRKKRYCLRTEKKVDSRSQSYQTFFLRKAKIFPFFAIKLACFIAKALISYVTNTQASQEKSENKEKTSLVGLTPVFGNEVLGFMVCLKNRIITTFQELF